MTNLARKPMIIWTNRFHKTTTKSTLTEEEAESIDLKIHDGYINSKHKDARKLKRLYDKLCPHKFDDCSCKAAMQFLQE